MKPRYSVFSLARNAMNYHKDWERAWRSPNPKSEYDAVIVGNDNPIGADNPGDNNSMWEGYDWDTVRFPSGSAMPLPDSEGDGKYPANKIYFHKSMGSPHSGGVNHVYVDGSVHSVGFDVDQGVYDGLGNRQDGKVY